MEKAGIQEEGKRGELGGKCSGSEKHINWPNLD